MDMKKYPSGFLLMVKWIFRGPICPTFLLSVGEITMPPNATMVIIGMNLDPNRKFYQL